MLLQPGVQGGGGIGQKREKGELVDDALIERGRLEEDRKRLGSEAIEFAEAVGRFLEHVRGEYVRALRAENGGEAFGQELFALDEIRAPNDAVRREVGEVRRDEVESDVGGERPIEQASRQSVMLGQREPVRHRIAGHDPSRGVFAEIAQQVSHQFGVVTAQAHEAGAQLALGGIG